MKKKKSVKYDYWATEERWMLYSKIFIEGSSLEHYIETELLGGLSLEFKKYINIYSRKTGLRKIAVLDAEYSYDSDFYDDFVVKFPKEADRGWTENWIKKNDGKYCAIIPLIDDLGLLDKITTRKSLLVSRDEGRDEKGFIIYSPIHDEIDDYLIEFSTRSLQRKRKFF